jgi:hypothetical protein
MADPEFDPALLDQFKNQLSIVQTLAEGLLATLPQGELRSDLFEMHSASVSAQALLPGLAADYQR